MLSLIELTGVGIFTKRIKVVSSHYRPSTTFLNGRFESRKINLIKSTVAQMNIGGVTVELLIV